ncbi:unnamed protein product [Ilex paraguariensis]|uniref:Uncharacterized protein n=1 Tax=Ilex paraguariensis TaxID=185542 RepID=A0ABC8S662_9AQUA
MGGRRNGEGMGSAPSGESMGGTRSGEVMGSAPSGEGMVVPVVERAAAAPVVERAEVVPVVERARVLRVGALGARALAGRAANDTYYNQCIKSGGQCGSNSTSNSATFACYRANRPYPLECIHNGTGMVYAPHLLGLVYVK